MRYARLACVVLASLVVGLLSVSAAYGLSTDNPAWEKESGLLGEGESISIGAKASGSQTLEAGKDKIKCRSVHAVEETGVENDIKGSTPPRPGTGVEELKWEECEVVGQSSCLINGESPGHGKVQTEPLKDTLEYSTKAAAEREESKTLNLFEPKERVFLDISLKGRCETEGEFEVVGGGILAENKNGSSFTDELEEDFPATPIRTYFKNVSGTTSEVKVEPPVGKTKGVKEGPNLFDFFVAVLIILIIGVLILLAIRIRW